MGGYAALRLPSVLIREGYCELGGNCRRIANKFRMIILTCLIFKVPYRVGFLFSDATRSVYSK